MASENKNKVAVLIGGNGTIGSETRKILLGNSYTVVTASRNPESANGTPNFTLDASDFDQVETLFRNVTEEYGKIDAAVNFAGSILLKPAHLTSSSEWQSVINTNLSTAFATVRAAGKYMRGGGSVLLMSSSAAQIGLSNHEAIAAAKAGVDGLVKSAAATYAKSKLRVNGIAPGLVDTQLAQPITSRPRAFEVSTAMHPLGRIGSAEEIARLAWFLLNPENDWITGQIIGVDGGLSTLKI